jgi:hypothetical protein
LATFLISRSTLSRRPSRYVAHVVAIATGTGPASRSSRQSEDQTTWSRRRDGVRARARTRADRAGVSKSRISGIDLAG